MAPCYLERRNNAAAQATGNCGSTNRRALATGKLKSLLFRFLWNRAGVGNPRWRPDEHSKRPGARPATPRPALRRAHQENGLLEL